MRFEGQKKMGYYPTPLSVIERIRGFIKYPEENLAILDPCCGEGIALEKLNGHPNCQTYGIELDQARAKTAKDRLHHVISGGYQESRVSNKSFSMMLLNPPYDFDEGTRKEEIFLRDTLRYIRPHGLLIYIIPQHRVNTKIATLLSFNFEDIAVYKFPDDEYEAYSQVVIFAVRKEQSCVDEDVKEMLAGIPNMNLEDIPEVDNPRYLLPGSEEKILFTSRALDEEELEASIKRSPVNKRLAPYFRPTDYRTTDYRTTQRPPLPLRTGHQALLLASGYLDGVVGKGGDLHVVKGRVHKEVKETTERTENEVTVKKTDVIRISVKVLLPDGEIKTLQ